MLTRREFLEVTAAAATLSGLSSSISRAAATQSITQADLLRFEPLGQVTLLHFADIHAQLVPLYYREPEVNLGVGSMRGELPHVTGKALMERLGVAAQSPQAYAFTHEDFTALARAYGKVGGLDRIATLVKAIRAERPGNTLLLDGGDTWQGSYTSLETRGSDMVEAMNVLGVECMTGHWEFTYGTDRVKELIDKTDFPFLAGNVVDRDWQEPVFESTAWYERGGVRIAVIGQAFPYTPVANPSYKIPNWSFGIREEAVQRHVDAAREQGAQLVVLLSHNGFDVDRKLAGRVRGIDILLTGHTHDAVPVAIEIGGTLMISSGSHGKFLSRLDLDVADGKVRDYRFRLIPIFADAIEPDPEMRSVVDRLRAPYAEDLRRVLGRTDSLLYRRGNFNGTFDDLICDALLAERDAEIALSPGFRWGATLLPGQDITVEDVHNQTSITYPNAYRMEMPGEQLKLVLEDVADNLFNPDPYYQQGGDMVRVGGMGYRIDVRKPMGERISEMTLLSSGEPIDSSRNYVVAGWASVNEAAEGPPVWDVVSRYIEHRKVVDVKENTAIRVVS